MILHHIQTSANSDNALKTALRFAAVTDSFVFSGNGVNTVLQPQWSSKLTPYQVYLLKDDIEARGLATLVRSYKQISYNDFVALTLSHNKVITW